MIYQNKKLSKTLHVILASQSPQRKTMMDTFGITYDVVPADIDEQGITAQTQFHRAQLVAQAKAAVVARRYPRAIILAGDTYVLQGERALEKPVSLAEARDMLRAQSGQTLTEISGVCYLDPHRGLAQSATIETEVTFRVLTDEEIDRFIQREPVLTWSAAFCPAYPTSAALIARIKGSLTNFTHGFPVEFFEPLLRGSGVLN